MKSIDAIKGDYTEAVPYPFMEQLNKEFDFTMEAGSNLYGDDLQESWSGVVWMNPPHGPELAEWVRKAWETARDGKATVVCLLPARPDAGWFHDYALKGEIRFIRGRLDFGKNRIPAALVIFKKKTRRGSPGSDFMAWNLVKRTQSAHECGGGCGQFIPEGTINVRRGVGRKDGKFQSIYVCATCAGEEPTQC